MDGNLFDFSKKLKLNFNSFNFIEASQETALELAGPDHELKAEIVNTIRICDVISVVSAVIFQETATGTTTIVDVVVEEEGIL